MRTTEELYGVKPTELRDMQYKAALELKVAGLKSRKKDLSDEMFTSDLTIPYERLCSLQMEHKAVSKALAINIFMLEEIR